MTVYYRDHAVTLLAGDARQTLASMPAESAACVVTSPPYFGLRDYQAPGQYGLEATVQAYADNLRAVFSEVSRVLAGDGTLWLNLGDCYSGGARASYDTTGGKTRGRGIASARPVGELPGKNMLGIPWRVVFGLQEDGWILRDAIIWHKPNAMPESVHDRLSCRYETVFLLVKQARHWFRHDAPTESPPSRQTRQSGPDRGRRNGAERHGGNCTHGPLFAECRGNRSGAAAGLPGGGRSAVRRAGREPGNVWVIPTRPFRAAHFAVFPIDIPMRCIAAGCRPGGVVLDPFSGAATTGLAARRLGNRYIGIDVNPAYHDLAIRRLAGSAGTQPTMPAPTPRTVLPPDPPDPAAGRPGGGEPPSATWRADWPCQGPPKTPRAPYHPGAWANMDEHTRAGPLRGGCTA